MTLLFYWRGCFRLQRYFICVARRFCIQEIGWSQFSFGVALPADELAEQDEAGEPLALAGVHPYNPLTGIMLSRGTSTGT
jgi:hypothetical protein